MEGHNRGTDIGPEMVPSTQWNRGWQPGKIMIHRHCLYPLAGLLCTATAQAWEAPPRFNTCVDYHCDIRQPVSLSPAEWGEIQHLFTPPATSARNERTQIKQAIARLEQLVGKKTETWRDLKENDGEGSEIGQLDCIAESLNTTRYLQFMAEDKLLKWHRVTDRQQRNPWSFSAHWTAVIEEQPSRQRYTVDSWFRASGKPPIVQTLTAWLAKEDIESEQAQ